MIKGLMELVAVATFLAILYVASYFPAKWMVKKRTFLAKKLLIGQETPENIEQMKMVARAVCAYNTIYLELLENEEYTVSTTVHHGTISEVKVENELVSILISNNGTEEVFQKGFGEKGATMMTAFYLTCLLIVIYAFCILFSLLFSIL